MRQLRRQLALVTVIVTTLIGLAFPAAASTDTKARADATARTLYVFGPYNIYNIATGKCVDIPGYSSGWVGATVNEYTCDYGSSDNQQFYLDQDAYDGSEFLIRNLKDDLCLDPPDNGWMPPGTPISEYTCQAGGGDNQQFQLIPRPGYRNYWLRNSKSGYCLDVVGMRTGGNDARLTLYPCDENDNDDHVWALI